MLDKDNTARIQTYLETNLPSYLDVLRQMVAINSFTYNPAGVNALGQLTADLFGELGFTAESVPAGKAQYGNHLFLTRPGRSGRSIALSSHLDTVFPLEEEIRNNFAWRPEGNRIYGPGTVDIKGGTLVIYIMLSAIQEHLPEVFEEITWQVMFDAAEEAEMMDFGEAARPRLLPNTLACLVFESGKMSGREFNVVCARKGMAVYQVTVEGRGAHAGGAHQDGANAVVQMAEVIQRIAGYTDYGRDLTFNVGTVSGGTVTNRVPHLATAGVEMRAFDMGVFEEAMAQMAALEEGVTIRSPADGYACVTRVELLKRTAPWPRNLGTDRLLGIWQKAAESLGWRAVPEHRGGLSDGNLLWQDVPTLDGLGPSGGNMHCSERSADGSKDQEFVLATSFVPKALLNTVAVLELIRP